jgi:outer membrane protein OmpA-like peptidoglycan-associated protein
VALLAGCAHEPNPLEVDAREQYTRAAQDPSIRDHAGVELYEAKQALDRLQSAVRRDDDQAEIEHRAYLTKQRVEIAKRAAESAALEQQARTLAESRDRMRLEAREAEARSAQNRASAAEAELAQARELAHVGALEAAEARAQSAEERAAQADQLRKELQELQAKQTERGLMLTLEGGLFATDRAELLPGATAELDRIAKFLEAHPDRDVIIEGHTDSVGDESYNMGLSERRAQAAADQLTRRGIDRSRIRVEGLGESRPVAPNNTAAGRQQNRRVEVVITQ